MRTGAFVVNRSVLNLLAAAGAALACASAQGSILNWTNVAGGSAATSGNWSPAQVPVAADALTFNLPNTYTVTFPAGVSQVTSHTFKRGTVTLSMSSPHTTSSFVRVGDISGDAVTTILTAGTLHAGAGLTIGNAAGSTGTLTVDNEGALLDTTAAGSDIIVGLAGTGTLTIRDGASVVPADDFIIGAAATGIGTVTVTGTGGLPLPVPSSLLDLTGAGKDLTVGSLGDGFFNVLAGARVNADEMFVALSPGSSGVVTVGGVGGLLSAHSQINIATGLHLGDNPGVGLSGGSSTFTVNDGGIVTVLGTTRIGDSAGVGSGTLTVNEGGVFTTGSLIATETGGFLNLLGGELHVNGGSLQVRNNFLTLGSSAAGSPVVALENGAACTLSNAVAPFEALIVGNTTSAALAVISGSHLTITGGDVILGNLAGSNGQLQVTGAESTATLPASRFLIVGDAGQGTLFVQSGAHLTTGAVNLGRTATGVGSATINNGTPVWDIIGTLGIGGTGAVGGAFGTGAVTIGGAGGAAGGTVNVTSGGLSRSVTVHGPGDSLTIGEGGTLNTDGDVVVFGDFTLAGGTLIADSLALETNNATYNFRGTVSGTLGLSRPTSTIVLTGDLFFDGGLYANSGTVEIGDHTLSIDALNNNALIDTCHLGPAGVLTSNAFGFVRSGHVLSGDGTVDARISNSGSIVSQGDGLTFTKVLSGIGQGISGTTINFGNGGGFTGSGAFSNTTPIVALSGSVITATGDLTMGSIESNNGFAAAGGTIVVDGDFIVILRDAARAIVSSIEFPLVGAGGAVVKCSGGIDVQPNGTLSGTGSIECSANADNIVAGTIDPGSASAPGSITSRGDLILNSSARTNIDIFAEGNDVLASSVLVTTSFPDFIQTAHRSDISLDGTLEIRVAAGYAPSSGERRKIVAPGFRAIFAPVATSSIIGTFATIIAPPRWIVQTVNSGTGFERGVFAVYCPADFNADGSLDPDDLADFIGSFFAQPAGAASDFNGDGTTDPDDLADFIGAFFQGCG